MPTILITGAGRGLGLELTRQFSADGWTVLATCRKPENATDLKGVEADAKGSVTIHRLDVTDLEQIQALSKELKDRPIDILMNNAGVYGPTGGGPGDVDESAWTDVLKVNTFAPLRMADAFLENVARGDRRIIATMTSKMGSIDDNTSGRHYPYRTSKAAVNMVMKGLAVDLRSRGIISVVLHPGWVRTAMGGRSAPLSAEESVRGLKAVLGRLTPAQSGRFLAWDGTEVPW